MNAHQPDLLYPHIGRCIGCAHSQCPHPTYKKNNPMGHCTDWTDGNKWPVAYEVTVTKTAYMVESDDVKLNCTPGCRKGLPRKRDYPIVFI